MSSILPRFQSSPSPAVPAGAYTDALVPLKSQPDLAVRIYGRRGRGGTPLVVHFHGGAFVAGGLDNGTFVAKVLAEAGAVVVSLAYPLAPAHPFPHGIESGYGALEWVFKHRTRLAGPGSRVYLAGEEAGANLAAAVALIARDRAHPALAGQILISPMLDPCVGTASVREAVGYATGCKWADGWQKYLRSPMDNEHPYAVPAATRRLADVPPTLVISSEDDVMRDDARGYAQRLEAAGVPVALEVLPTVTGWPDRLLEPVPSDECPCRPAVLRRLRDFFTRTSTQDARPASAQPCVR